MENGSHFVLAAMCFQVNIIGLIMMHGLKEHHIAPYTDFEFQQGKFQTNIAIES